MDVNTPQRYLPRLTAMAAAALAVAAGILASDAQAQIGFCKQEAYYTASGYVYRRCGVPDFDQKRLNDLPDNGAVHCVPTSTMNWMAYIADRGLGIVKPGPGLSDPTPNATQYDAISNAIEDLGVLMNVSLANGGTNASNWQSGTRQWLAQSLGSQFIADLLFGVSYNYGSDLAGIRFRPGAPSLGGSAAMGALVIPNVGWYSAIAGAPSNDYTRNGGHVVSLSRARPGTGAESPYVLYFNDPANDGYNSTQSTFVGQPYGVESPTIAIMGGQTNLISKVSGYGSGWLEGLLTITPKFALLPDPVTFGGFKLVKALSFLEKGEDDKTIDLGVVGDVLDYQIAPTSAEHPFLLADGTLLMVNAVDGSSRKLGLFEGARRLAYDDKWRLNVLMGDGSVRSLAPDGRTVGRFKLPVPPEEIIYNPALKRFLALDQDEGVLHVLSPSFRAETKILLPAVAKAQGKVSLTVNRRTGQIGVLPEGSPVLYRIDRVGKEYQVDSREFPTGGVKPLSAFADDSGAWYIVGDDHRIQVFDADGKTVEKSPFAGLDSGPLLRIAQSEAIGDDLGSDVLPDRAPRPQREVRLTGVNEAAVGSRTRVSIRLLARSEPGNASRPLRWQRTGAHPGRGALKTDLEGRAWLGWLGSNVGHDDLLVWEDGNGDGKRQFDEAAAFLGVEWTAPR